LHAYKRNIREILSAQANGVEADEEVPTAPIKQGRQRHVHTNGLENFWSLSKRTLKGSFISVEPLHLFRYLNERKDAHGDRGRFRTVVRGCARKRLTYKEVTGKLNRDCP